MESLATRDLPCGRTLKKKNIIGQAIKSSIVQFMRQGPPAHDGIPSLHSDGEALHEVACFSCVTCNLRDTPTELGDKI